MLQKLRVTLRIFVLHVQVLLIIRKKINMYKMNFAFHSNLEVENDEDNIFLTFFTFNI